MLELAEGKSGLGKYRFGFDSLSRRWFLVNKVQEAI